MMTLRAGDATGEKAEAHERSDQVLLMLEGELAGEVGNEKPMLEERGRYNYPGRRETSFHEQVGSTRRDIQCLFAAGLSGED